MGKFLRRAGALILLSSSSAAFAFSSTALPAVSDLKSAVSHPGSARSLFFAAAASPGRSAVGAWSSRARSAPVMNLFGSVTKGISSAMRGGAGVEYTPRSAAFVAGAPSWETLKNEVTALEATQRQNDSFFSQLPYKCYLEEVASVGDT